MENLAQIIVNVRSDGLDKPFTYRVPDGVRLLPGSRVVIPFGRQRLEGYCVGLTSSPFEGELRDIEEVLDDEPLLTAELISLSQWGAGRYICSRADFLQAMLPAGVRFSSDKTVQYCGPDEPAFAYLAFLQKMGKITVAGWQKKFPGVLNTALLHRLQQSGIIEIKKRDRRGLKEKQVTTAQITEAGRKAAVRGKLQATALEYLARHGKTHVPELSGAGISGNTLSSLAKKGYIRLEKEQLRRDPLAGETIVPEAHPEPTAAQAAALKVIENSLQGRGPRRILLHGVTGSGKTEVYLQAIRSVASQGKGSIVLVPEIALTPQMIERFTGRFGRRVAVLHSRLSAGERYDEWKRVASGDADVAIGTRSAVFAPFKNLGLVIVDEEHEPSYKQEEIPRYHAREVALWRAGHNSATLILGSATPSLETYRLALSGEYALCALPERVERRQLPPVEIVDMRAELKEGHRSLFSRRMLGALGKALGDGKQAILFLNRRGYATFVLCRSCGYAIRCPSCQVALKYHASDGSLQCHYCSHTEKYPLACPSCAGCYIKHFGTGTQRVAEEVQIYFPQARIARLDADATAEKGAYQKILTSFKRGETDILIGTQMVAKGLDFPNVTFVGVVTADTLLNIPDFRAGERTFQLLTQVAGRAGRGPAGGEVVVQTYTPGHYAVIAAKDHDYKAFFELESRAREELSYPPYASLIRLILTGEAEEAVVAAATTLAGHLEGEVEVIGPSPCPIGKLRGKFRWHMLVRGTLSETWLSRVREAGEWFKRGNLSARVRLAIDVDPVNLL